MGIAKKTLRPIGEKVITACLTIPDILEEMEKKGLAAQVAKHKKLRLYFRTRPARRVKQRLLLKVSQWHRQKRMVANVESWIKVR